MESLKHEFLSHVRNWLIDGPITGISNNVWAFTTVYNRYFSIRAEILDTRAVIYCIDDWTFETERNTWKSSQFRVPTSEKSSGAWQRKPERNKSPLMKQWRGTMRDENRILRIAASCFLSRPSVLPLLGNFWIARERPDKRTNDAQPHEKWWRHMWEKRWNILMLYFIWNDFLGKVRNKGR